MARYRYRQPDVPHKDMEAVEALLPCDVIVYAYGGEPVKLRATRLVAPRGVFVQPTDSQGRVYSGIGFPVNHVFVYDEAWYIALREAYERDDDISLGRLWSSRPNIVGSRAVLMWSLGEGARSEPPADAPSLSVDPSPSPEHATTLRTCPTCDRILAEYEADHRHE